MIPFVLSSLLTLSIEPIVAVDGDTACPTAQEVSARVAALMPATGPNASPDLARVEETETTMRVSLRRPDGALIGSRELSRTFSCSELAAAAAVVLATWESDVHPEFWSSMPPSPESRPAASSVVAAVQAPKPPGSRVVLDAGLGVSGSVAPGGGSVGTAAGGLLVVGGAWPGRRLGARLALAAGTERELPLGTARVRWRRLVGALGPDVRLHPASASLTLELHGEALLASVSATGEGFSMDLNGGGIDPGIGAGARLLIGGHAIVPWVDLSVGEWLRAERAFSQPDQASITLPRTEAALALGVSLFIGR